MTNEGDVARATPGTPLTAWSSRLLLAGLLALALGTILAILGVKTGGLLLPGVYVLDLALVLLAIAGILRLTQP